MSKEKLKFNEDNEVAKKKQKKNHDDDNYCFNEKQQWK